MKDSRDRHFDYGEGRKRNCYSRRRVPLPLAPKLSRTGLYVIWKSIVRNATSQLPRLSIRVNNSSFATQLKILGQQGGHLPVALLHPLISPLCGLKKRG